MADHILINRLFKRILPADSNHTIDRTKNSIKNFSTSVFLEIGALKKTFIQVDHDLKGIKEHAL